MNEKAVIKITTLKKRDLPFFPRWKDFILLLLMSLLISSLVYSSVLAFVTSQNEVVVDFSFTNEWGTYDGSAYYRDGTVDAPIIIFLHGLGSSKEYHSWMVDAFLEAGYVFVMFNVPGGITDILSGEPNINRYTDSFSPCIDTLLEISELKEVANFELIGAGLGALVSATQDPRIKIVVALSPPINITPFLPKPTMFNIPIQLQVGTYEEEIYPGITQYYEQELVAPIMELLVIEGGNHIQYMDASIVTMINLLSIFMEIPYIGNEPADITVDEQHLQSSQAYLRFFNTYLLNTSSPVAEAGGDRERYLGDLVNFDGSGSTASNGYTIIKYEWDFENDGSIDAEGAKPVHTYEQIGQYEAVLYVTDSLGKTDTDTATVIIREYILSASFTYTPSNPTIQDLISFFDTSEDYEEPIVSWLWEFGDGTTVTLQNVTHRFSTKGDHEVTLKVTDANAEDSITQIIVVRNLPPNASFTYAPSNPNEGEEIQFTDLSTDPEDQQFSRLWEFGDGSTSDQINPTHTYTDLGEYACTLTVSDDENATSTFTILITITENITFPIPLWGIAPVVIIIVGMSIYLIRVRFKNSGQP
jgi:PKD repeat protein